ncbi:DUF2007 domain-containing protein [Thiohalophilus sp.]|uniref:putative signal transducing protein n=1 Tax=Thiohalophilus sp. TaxID=3028392 RepID=UPI003975E956
MVIIYNANDYIEGNLVRGLLESQGIDTYVNGEYLQGGIGVLIPMGHIKLSVDDEDESAALRIIERYENGEFQIGENEEV